MPIKVNDPTNIQAAYDDLGSAEKRGSDTSYADGNGAKPNTSTDDTASQIQDKETDPRSRGGWGVDRSPKDSSTPPTPGRAQGLVKGLKIAAPTGGIIGGLIAAVIGLGGLSSPVILLNHLTAGFLDKWDTRTTTATIRTNKLIVKKLVGDTTSGSCSYVKMLCRYNKPSNALLKKLDKQGIKAVDKAGKTIAGGGLWPNSRPDHFQFTRSNGIVSDVSAAQFSSTLQNDVEFRKAFHAAYNTRFQNFADSVYQRVLARFGTSKADKVGDVKDDKAAKEKINAASEGEDIGAKAAAQEGGDAADGVVKKLLGEELTKMIEKIGKAGKGDAIGLAAGVACLAADGPGVASKVVRAYQMSQVVKIFMIFATIADKIRAGDAITQEVSTAGSLLTTTYKDSSGNVTNRAAVDSFGVKNGLFGDTNASQETTGHSYKKYQPGGSLVASLSGITKITDSKMKKEGCALATNPLTGLAVNVALASTGVGIVVAGINFGVGLLVGSLVEKLAAPIAEGAATLLHPAFQNILTGLLGDFTEGAEGEDLGNALASGAAHMLSQSANAGGNVPLSVSDAVVFQDTQKQVNLAYAEEDRASLSPFDTSSPNTFLGSIVNQFIPYSSQMASVSGLFSTISSISLGSFGNIISPSTHADAAKEYAMCDDTSINDGSLATGPFCNIVYGIPTTYIDIDPVDVLQWLIGKGFIDEDTGDPKPDSELEIWMNTCLDGKTDQAVNCKVDGPGVSSDDSRKFAYFALYTVDHQIQKNMDDQDVVLADGGSGGGGTPTDPGDGTIPPITGLPDGGVKDTAEGKKQAWAIAQQFITDLNKIRKGGKGYPFKNISNYNLGYNKSAGTPGSSSSGGPCFVGASNCDQCYALVAWFLDKYTSKNIGTTTRSGDGVVAYLGKHGVPTGSEAKVYSIFSYGRAVDGSGAHTGVVVGIDGNYAITVENNFNFGGTLYINKRPKSGLAFRGTGDRTTFAYINGIMKSTPKAF
ncbi:MAG: hypothetical protein ABIP74_00030 [Candidatus Saccharimonas sp.]